MRNDFQHNSHTNAHKNQNHCFMQNRRKNQNLWCIDKWYGCKPMCAFVIADISKVIVNKKVKATLTNVLQRICLSM